MKSLAEQLRNELKKPDAKKEGAVKVKPSTGGNAPERAAGNAAALLEAMQQLDVSGNDKVIHGRLDVKTLAIVNQFKMASGIDNSKFLAFAVHYLLETRPEIKTIIKQFIKNNEL